VNEKPETRRGKTMSRTLGKPPIEAASLAVDAAEEVSANWSFREMLGRYWRAAVRWKAIIFSIVVTALVIGMVVTLMMSTQFTAVSRIEVSRDQNKALNGRIPDGPAQDEAFYNTQYALLHAQSLTARVVRQMNLAQSQDFFLVHGKSPPGGTGPAARSAPEFRAARERLAMDLLEQNVDITPIRGSALLDISYTCRSPLWSAFIVNGWVRQFAQANMDRRRAATADARNFLERAMAQLRSRIADSDRNAMLYASRSGIVATPATTVDDMTKGTLKPSPPKAAADPVLSTLVTGAGTTPPSSNATLTTLRAKRAEAEAEYARLLIQFKPQYPSVLALSREIRALSDNIAREEHRASTAQAVQDDIAARRDSRMLNALGDPQVRLTRKNSDTAHYDFFRRQADTDRQIYDGYLQRYRQIAAAEIGATDVVVVDPAQVPDKPSSPRLARNMAIAALAGIVLAGLVIFVLERADHSVSEPTDLAGLLAIPLLGATPDLAAETVQTLLSDPDSALSETYRKIWANLVATGEQAPRSVMITSTRRHEGKSTTSLAIALLLARAGRTVALVDADLRRPSMHEHIDAQNEKGLSNILADEEDWRPLMQPLEKGGISLLSAGQLPTGAADLFRGERMRTLVGELAEAFDLVIVDAPPMLDIPDAPLISASVETVLYVIEAGGVGVKAARGAIDRLRDADARIAGGIITKLGDQNSNYHYAQL
jgi:capsular exopolysaccharide synthesis family protein